MDKYKSVIPTFGHMIHGADYNPEQWIETPEVWDEDMRLMKLAGMNSASVGIFSWSMLEPEEGKYDFSFLDTIMDKLAKNGMKAVLATPSGARPAWLSKKYPEVLRVTPERVRRLHGLRHNHCMSSPIYRKKVSELNKRLAERYKNHPALGLWHISNEISGECHCELCQENFRSWLRKKYNNDIDKLNHEWWSRFWSYRYNSFDEIESPSPIGMQGFHGLELDWKRFVTDITVDFFRCETKPLHEITPNIPITTNLMGFCPEIDCRVLAKELDVVSWDNYPLWHGDNQQNVASTAAMSHDLTRGLKGDKPYLMMESTPSCINWTPYNKLKRPGMHILSSIQAIAHGSDSVQYFQWRKSRGSCEKFHGAVVDHVGHENTRVFKEVSELGDILKKLDDVVGTRVKSEVAFIHEWPSTWALDECQGFQRHEKKYRETLNAHYTPFWKNGINTDIIGAEADFSKYKLIIAPMLYMTDEGLIKRLAEYVEKGGTLVFTYISGLVNENDLCWLGGFPGGKLKEVFGLWAEETDTLYPGQYNTVRLSDGRKYRAVDYCEVVHPQGAEVLAEYTDDFYKGCPALLKNSYGKGNAYYIAFRDTGDFSNDFYCELAASLKIERSFDGELPPLVSAHSREDGEHKYVFVENYSDKQVKLKTGTVYENVLTGEQESGIVDVDGYGVKLFKLRK